MDVISQIALEFLIVSTVDTVVQPIGPHPNVQTVSKAGWVQLAMIGASMAIQRKECANAIHVTPTKVVIVNVPEMENASKVVIVSAIRFQEMLIQDRTVSFQDARARMETAMAVASVILKYNGASAMQVGQATLVMSQTAQEIPGVLVMGSVVKLCLEDATATKIGQERAVKCPV